MKNWSGEWEIQKLCLDISLKTVFQIVVIIVFTNDQFSLLFQIFVEDIRRICKPNINCINRNKCPKAQSTRKSHQIMTFIQINFELPRAVNATWREWKDLLQGRKTDESDFNKIKSIRDVFGVTTKQWYGN